MNKQALLFDTGVLIDIYIGRERVRPYFEQIRVAETEGYVSVISEAELWRGLRSGELKAHQALLSRFQILPLQSEEAQLAGRWMQRYKNQGLGWMDALITATATVASVPVLTRDKRLVQVLGRDAQFQLYD